MGESDSVDGGEIGLLDHAQAVLQVGGGFVGGEGQGGLGEVHAARIDEIDVVGVGEALEEILVGAADAAVAGAAVEEEEGPGGGVGGQHAGNGDFDDVGGGGAAVLGDEDVTEVGVGIAEGAFDELRGPVGGSELGVERDGVGVDGEAPRAGGGAVANDGGKKGLGVGGVEVEGVGAIGLAEGGGVGGGEQIGGEIGRGVEIEGEGLAQGGGNAEPLNVIAGRDAVGGGAGGEDGDGGFGAVVDAEEGEGAIGAGAQGGALVAAEAGGEGDGVVGDGHGVDNLAVEQENVVFGGEFDGGDGEAGFVAQPGDVVGVDVGGPPAAEAIRPGGIEAEDAGRLLAKNGGIGDAIGEALVHAEDAADGLGEEELRGDGVGGGEPAGFAVGERSRGGGVGVGVGVGEKSIAGGFEAIESVARHKRAVGGEGDDGGRSGDDGGRAGVDGGRRGDAGFLLVGPLEGAIHDFVVGG